MLLLSKFHVMLVVKINFPCIGNLLPDCCQEPKFMRTPTLLPAEKMQKLLHV